MKLAVKFTRCRDNQPLLVLENQPFNGLEIRPDALGQLGQTLMWLADLGRALPTTGRNWKPSSVEFDTAPVQSDEPTADVVTEAIQAIRFASDVSSQFNKTNQG